MAYCPTGCIFSGSLTGLRAVNDGKMACPWRVWTSSRPAKCKEAGREHATHFRIRVAYSGARSWQWGARNCVNEQELGILARCPPRCARGSLPWIPPSLPRKFTSPPSKFLLPPSLSLYSSTPRLLSAHQSECSLEACAQSTSLQFTRRRQYLMLPFDATAETRCSALPYIR